MPCGKAHAGLRSMVDRPATTAGDSIQHAYRSRWWKTLEHLAHCRECHNQAMRDREIKSAIAWFVKSEMRRVLPGEVRALNRRTAAK